MCGYPTDPRDRHPAGRRAHTGGVSLGIYLSQLGMQAYRCLCSTDQCSHAGFQSAASLRVSPPSNTWLNLPRASMLLLRICGLVSAISISCFRCEAQLLPVREALESGDRSSLVHVMEGPKDRAGMGKQAVRISKQEWR